MKEKEIFIESMFDDSFDRFSHTFSVVAVYLCEGESMGNVPPYTRPSPNWLKLSGFIELDELIIFVSDHKRFRCNLS